jgi:XTP/dITP diphosphohydrolase
MTTESIIFATNNQHKANEMKNILQDRFRIKTLKEAGIFIDIPEPFHTLEENAREKSRVIHQLTNENCFSEDTGLEVEALDGEPGVRSARYAGEDCDFKQNIAKLLEKMNGIQNRNAQFRTVISILLKGEEFQFEGVCKGLITNQETGENGFGYDAVFIPEGSDKTFAQMSMDQKSLFSHRKKATEKLIDFLKKI